MKKKYAVIFLLLLLLFMFSGCANTGYGVSARFPANPAVQATVVNAPPPSYEEQGPPPWAPAHGHRAKYRYRYYPSNEVYFDMGRGLYFYYRDRSWRASVSIPASISANISSGFVSLEMDTARPFIHHHEVQKRYPHEKGRKYRKQKKVKNKYRNQYSYDRDRGRYGNRWD